MGDCKRSDFYAILHCMLRKILAALFLAVLLLVVGGYYKNGLKKKPKLNQQVTGIVAFRDVCKKAVHDDHYFRNFKRDPIYTLFFENLNFEQGKEILAKVEPNLLQPELLEKYRLSDSFGGCFLYSFEKIGQFSSSTLRYVKIASDLKKSFGSLDGMHIVEIGGGHGALCKIIHDIATPASYMIVDNKETLSLAKKALSLQGLNNIHFVRPEKLKKESWDLIISDYSFTESSQHLQKAYVDKIFNQTPRGYLTCNFFAKHFRVRPMPKKTLLKSLQKREIQFAEELPHTGPENFVAIWGTCL